MEIKTIRWYLRYADGFDEAVNNALAEGWTLTRRDVIVSNDPEVPHTLYAELVRMQEAKRMTWEDAVRVLIDTCAAAKTCEAGECPMFDWCHKALPEKEPADEPQEWPDPAEV